MVKLLHRQDSRKFPRRACTLEQLARVFLRLAAEVSRRHPSARHFQIAAEQDHIVLLFDRAFTSAERRLSPEVLLRLSRRYEPLVLAEPSA
jgi:hypothetical protein